MGGKGDGVQAVTKEVSEGDVIQLGDVTIGVIDTPCHTPGHVCYVARLVQEYAIL